MKKLDDGVLEILKPGSTKRNFVPAADDLNVIAKGLLPDGLDIGKLTPLGRQELREAIDRVLAADNARRAGPAPVGFNVGFYIDDNGDDGR